MISQRTQVEKHSGVADKLTDKIKDNKMNWILNKTSISENKFKEVEGKLDVEFPSDFKEIVLNYNGASPAQMTFDTSKNKERVAEYLLSFNENDEDNIFSAISSIKDRTKLNLVPVMRDPFGNFICFDFTNENKKELYFWSHEDNSLEYISETFSDFLNNLYE